MKNIHTAAIILAAGSGTRMNTNVTKQQLLIGGISVLKRTLLAFDNAKTIDEIVVVAKEGETDFVKSELAGIKKGIKVVIGGKTRAESAKIGFASISKTASYVAIHDAARCLIHPSDVDRVVREAFSSDAAFASCSITDTIKAVDSDNRALRTIPRDTIVAAQTPQVFSVNKYSQALSVSYDNLESITDDNMLLEAIGVHPLAVDVGKYNIKITTPEDVVFAELLLSEFGGDK